MPRNIILVCALMGASIGTVFQALRITGRPQEFRSLATIKIPALHSVPDGAERIERGNLIVETIESPELKRRAWYRVNALNPNLKTGDVAIQAAQAKGSAVFNILATGTDPKVTRLFLDALIDEFVIFRINISRMSDPEPPVEFLQSLTVVQQRALPATEHLEDWDLPIALGVGGGGLLGALMGFLLSLLIVRGPKPPQVTAVG